MRFSRLSLERYGRFEDCELHFRSGKPDLHIIYGANEAGKTTSLAAVSDLLFGFLARSPYNFLFDYSLLRVGAVLEDGERIFACRRKKGLANTLLDVADATVDEAPLISMLKGQTRDTFGLSFSLDQDALRSGGRAMIEAKNDLGRTLFAAGSGLTGIADELNKLEGEADAIWASSTSQRRTFTQAHRQFSEATKAIRDGALKPKSWSDARKAAEGTHATLEAARKARDEVQSELRKIERIRRMAPLVRTRDEQLKELQSYDSTIDLGKQREETAEKIIQEVDDAQRQRTAAIQLQVEAAERRGRIKADPAIFAEADEIDQLVTDAGANEKAAQDLARLEPELAASEALSLRLRMEAGTNADAAPSRAVAAKLRNLAQVHGEIAAEGRQIAKSRAALEDRRKRAQDKLEDSPAVEVFDTLSDAVDAARALGSEVDVRCDLAHQKVGASSLVLAPLLLRLTPWHGGIEDLLVLPTVSDGEFETVRATLVEIEKEIQREDEQAQRLTDQATAAALEIEQLTTGSAVSPEEITAARYDRQQQWLPIRDHVLEGTALPSPQSVVAGFEASIMLVDDKMELRFTFADASSRLSLLKQGKATQELQADQARHRAENARRRYTESIETWWKRLSAVNLPALEPSRFLTWRADREMAEAAHKRYLDLRAELDGLVKRRDGCRGVLAEVLGIVDPGDQLSPVLAIAERTRQKFEKAAQQRRSTREQLEEVNSDVIGLDRRQAQLDQDAVANTGSWNDVLGEAALKLDFVTCNAVLDLLDELRGANTLEADLRRRVEGIRRDARDYASRVHSVADGLGIEPGETTGRFRALRDRLAAARTTATRIEAIEEEERKRSDEADEANAKLMAANGALTQFLTETGTTERADLSTAIERSRTKRRVLGDLASTERRIVEEGDGLAFDELLTIVAAADPGRIGDQIATLNIKLDELNDEIDQAATAHGDARSVFAALNTGAMSAVDAASDAEQAQAELEVLTEHYILKRAQVVTLKWAIEKYRERHQDPLLLRAGTLFSILTTGRYSALRVDADGPSPRLLGLRDDGRTMVEVGAMSEGTSDQLFLSLRLAALEQSVAAGINLPFLADDLFVNFDDERAEAGFKVLAEIAKSTQVLFFTHHPHLVSISKRVVGAEFHSECTLN